MVLLLLHLAGDCTPQILPMTDKKVILTKETAAAKLQRMALEIAEQLSGDDAPLVIIGIRRSGMIIAEKIADTLRNGIGVPLHLMSVSLDKHKPDEVVLSENIDLNGKNIILVDDVCNSGKTLLYALHPLLGFYPKRIQTLVLVERMHKLFPVKPDYVGLSVATTSTDFVQVEESEEGISAVLISE